jgi:hypothetical protein
MSVKKSDWKLFMERLPEWQERFMGKLNQEYIQLLSRDLDPSENFWELERRIREDKRLLGVRMELNKGNMTFDLMRLLHDGVIEKEDLADFSQELQDEVSILEERFR